MLRIHIKTDSRKLRCMWCWFCCESYAKKTTDHKCNCDICMKRIWMILDFGFRSGPLKPAFATCLLYLLYFIILYSTILYCTIQYYTVHCVIYCNTYIHTDRYVYLCTFLLTYILTYIHTYIHTHTKDHLPCMHTRCCNCFEESIVFYTYILTCIHTYTHTYIHTNRYRYMRTYV